MSRLLQKDLKHGTVRWWTVIVIVAFCVGCTRQSVTISGDTPITGSFDPAFAIPLVHGAWSFGDALSAMEVPGDIATNSDGSITAIFPFEAFESRPFELTPFSGGVQESLTLDADQASALSALPTGHWIEFTLESEMTIEVPQLSMIDSIWLGVGELDIAIATAGDLNCEISGDCDNLRQGGQAMVVEASASGTSTFGQTIETNGYTLVGNGSSHITFDWYWTIEVQSSGQTIVPGTLVDLEVQFNEVAVEAVFGVFDDQLAHPIEATLAMPEWASWDPALFYLSEPRLVLGLSNSFGLNLALAMEELAIVSGNESLALSGTAVNTVPILARAESIGDTTLTQHILDNQGVDPELSSILNLAPDSLSLTGTVGPLPADEDNQFATATDMLKCEGNIEIPLAGWADGVRWSDTIAAPISDDLQAGLAPNLDWTDVQSITLRFIASNGWPLELTGQTHFINAAGDSLLTGPMLTIPAGEPLSQGADPIGEVVEPTEAIVDFVLERDVALELLGMECEGVVLHVDVSTASSATSQEVRIRSQNAFGLRLAAMVQTEIDLNP